MREILADLVAEQQALDQMLQRAPERDWKRPTPAAGWSVQDTISHLAATEESARRALSGDPGLRAEVEAAGGIDAYNRAGIEPGRSKRPQEVIEWWRHSRAAVVEILSRTSRQTRVAWYAGPMSARTFATTRLMETWAHGLDIVAALPREVADTARLRHIAWLGWKTLPYAFDRAGEAYPAPIRVELVGPGYARWVFGPEGSDQVVRGQAADWCRLVVRRLPAARPHSLTAAGEVAATALRVARAYV
ncbi:MAG: maleylpyruvate isomerase family mycothiol-dependent enzyme [Actinobacteria bacterium]|nr:maleylpyruvate isomerase family mycothiol-dependent enzyme [Actinomycetota bacterium]